jgi:hypothetical protein
LQQLDLQDSRIEAELAEADARKDMERCNQLMREKERIQRERGRLSAHANVGHRTSRRRRKQLPNSNPTPPEPNDQ